MDKDTAVTKILHAISLDTTNVYPFDTILDNYISAGDTMGSGTRSGGITVNRPFYFGDVIK